MNTTGVIGRIKSILKEREMSHKDLADLLEEHKASVVSGTGTVSRYLRCETSPRLKWLLGVADVLNLDYRWLLSGDRNGWDEMPRETVRLTNGDDSPKIEFEIPAGWPDLNLRVFPDVDEPLHIGIQREEN